LQSGVNCVEEEMGMNSSLKSDSDNYNNPGKFAQAGIINPSLITISKYACNLMSRCLKIHTLGATGFSINNKKICRLLDWT